MPYTGITSGDSISDHAGPIARTVLEAASCLDALSGKDPYDDRTLGTTAPGTSKFTERLLSRREHVKGLRIGILREGFEHQLVNRHVKETVLTAIEGFKKLGATVEEVSLPIHLEGPALWTIQQRVAGAMSILGQQHGRRGLFATEFEAARGPWTNESFQKLFPSTKNTVINGLSLMKNYPGVYAKALNLAQKIKDSYEELFEESDLVVMPTTPCVAPAHADWKEGESPMEALKPSMGLTINTAIFNLTGQPALSIPVGFVPAKEDSSVLLPVGMQLVTGMWQEQKILDAAYAWEQAYDWKQAKWS